MTEFIQISTTTDAKAKAEAIAAALVEKRLAACVQIVGPVTSVYCWQDAVEHAEEWLCTAKTKASLFAQVDTTIRELHTYDCPEIIATPIADGSEGYLKWLGENC